MVIVLLAPVIVLIGLGYILRRIEFPGDAFWPAVEQLTYYVFYPALLFISIARSDLPDLNAGRFAFVLLGALFCMAVVLAVLRRVMGWSGPRYTSIYQGSMRWNGFVALAVADAYIGPNGLAMTAVGIAVLVPTLNVLSVFTLTRHAGTAPQSLNRVLSLLARNPLILSCLLGIFVNWIGIDMPVVVLNTLALLGDAALTIGLLAVGASLQISIPRSSMAQLTIVSALKLLLMPAFVAIGCWLLGVTGIPYYAALVCASVPTAPSSYILARQLGGDVEFMGQAVTVSTLAAAITLPLIFYLTLT